MKADIDTLKDTFKFGYEAYEESRKEANEVWDLFHNRQYTDDQLAVLENRGQPKETFNVIKLFARMLLGYYSTVVNTIQALPVQQEDVTIASVMTDVMQTTLRLNNFDAEGDKIKLSGIISGIMASYIEVYDTGEVDQYGRPLRDIALSYVPDSELVLDPMSRLEDYSDARFIHRFRWFSQDQAERLFGKAKVEKLAAYENHLDIDEAEFTAIYNNEFTGYYKVFDNYLIVHSVITDSDDRTWSVYWSGDEILDKQEITFQEVRFPYRVHKIHTSDRTEYYGIFREVTETQKAINQAVVKIQLMVNTQKAFVEEGAVDNLADFTDAFNRVNAVIPVKDLNGIRVESLSREVLDQYTVIDRALDRIQRILSINDSFLGMAYASDSGRKVKLQQNATITALRYLTGRIQQFYRLLGKDIASLVKQYYTANQVMRVADDVVGQRWIELNKPLMVWKGQVDQQGQPVLEPVFEQVVDPATEEPMVDDQGNYIIAPVPEADTEVSFSKFDIEITSTAYNDEDEKNQLMMETMLSGNVGSLLAQVNPAGYFQAAALSVRSVKTKYSPEISQILANTSAMLAQNQQAAGQASMMAQGTVGGNQATQQRLSQELKLPQNTNEGI